MQLLWQEGGLDKLAQWTPECTWKLEQMLMEYHDVFSLVLADRPAPLGRSPGTPSVTVV